LQAQVGGVLQTLTNAGATKATTTDGRLYLKIQGQANVPQPALVAVIVPRPVAVGTYGLGSAATNDRQMGAYQALGIGGINAMTFDNGTGGSGSVTIEAASDTHVSGHFSMSVKDTAFGVTINVTNGTFSLPVP
jgi:hypothetical protein